MKVSHLFFPVVTVKKRAESLILKACYSSHKCMFVDAQGESKSASQQLFSQRKIISVPVSVKPFENEGFFQPLPCSHKRDT